MVELVELMLDPSASSELALRNSKGRARHKQLPKSRSPHEQGSFRRTIEATNNQIDALVCELYGLTDDEIRVDENAAGGSRRPTCVYKT